MDARLPKLGPNKVGEVKETFSPHQKLCPHRSKRIYPYHPPSVNVIGPDIGGELRTM